MPKLQGVEQYNAKKENSIKGYRIALSKTGNNIFVILNFCLFFSP